MATMGADPLRGAPTPAKQQVQSVYYAEFDSTGRLKKPEGSGNFRLKKGKT